MLIGFITLYLIYFVIVVNLPLIFDVLLFLVDLFWRCLWFFLKLPFQVIAKLYNWIVRSILAVYNCGWSLLKLPFQVIGKFYDWIERSIFAVWYWGASLPQIMGRITLKYCLRAGHSIRGAVVFLSYLVDEALHGEEEEEYFDYEQTEDEDEPDEEQAQNDSYEKALKLLGLQASCTQESFKHAFKIAMIQAHPDKGGSDDQAVAVNAARDIIKIQNNWR